MNQEFIDAMQRVLDYLWEDERKHFECSEDKAGHIFEALEVLRAGVDDLKQARGQTQQMGQGR